MKLSPNASCSTAQDTPRGYPGATGCGLRELSLAGTLVAWGVA